ncbi:MAG: hypothetical protein HDS37_02160 [Bacteroides sp.]|nr:hypothetical protein [Bacteroides sp.]
MRMILWIIAGISIAGLFTACDGNLHHSLEMAGDNREGLENVLRHFKDDPDPLKYKAAKFLIENMPYHYSFEGKGIEQYDSVYLAMSAVPLQIRDSILHASLDSIDFTDKTGVADIQNMNAAQLIRIIDEACDVWRTSSWRGDYADEMFLEYVLPYRIYNEQLSNWQTDVDREFPYLMSKTIRSKNGPMIQAEDSESRLAPIVESESAFGGKMRLLSDNCSSVSFKIHSSLPSSKHITLRYAATDRSAKVRLVFNGESIGELQLDPTLTMKIFRNSRQGIDIDLDEGSNTLTVEHLSGKVGLDYIMVNTVENSESIPDEDFSKAYYRIINKASGKYLTFDTTEVLKKTELHPLDERADNTLTRLDHQGYKCWSISSALETESPLSLEIQYCSTDENSPVGQYTYWNGGNQQWIFIPVGEGLHRIMSKDSGLSLETITESDGTERIIQTSYAGRDSQKWKLAPTGMRLENLSNFRAGDPVDKAFKVFDVIPCYEWISFPSGIMPKGASLLKGKTGNCREEAAFIVMLCRRLGIPAAVEFTPHWANRSQAHLWSVIIRPDGSSVPFYMGTAPGDTVSYFHPYLKPKVYRHRFSLNRNIVKDFRGEKEYPRLFHHPDFIDVTDEYYTTTDIVRDIPAEEARKGGIAYICVFDNREWVPVDYGKISSGKVTFKSMVGNIAYMAATYRDGQIRPFGNPFILQSDGRVMDIIPDTTALQKMTLLRKYPFMGEQDHFNWRMNGGVFEGSQSQDFSNTTELHRHEGITHGNWYDIKIDDPIPYRAFRYLGPNGSYCNINELELFDEKDRRISGTITGSTGSPGKTLYKVFDKDILTGFEGESPDGHWVGVRFDKPTKIGRIRYIGRNDGNGIEIGDEYELIYWHEGSWTSLGKQTAETNDLYYDSIPSGGLYVLRNLTKGHEERIFTFEDGKQIWW